MALASGTSIEAFGGYAEVTDATNDTVVNDAFSLQTDLDSTTPEWTNSDDASFASFRLDATWASAPTVNTPVNLYARLIEVDGTNDEPQTDATYQNHYLGSFIVDAVTSAQKLVLADAPLPNGNTSQKIEFYIENKTGQTISANWRLYVNPKGFAVVA